MKKVISSQKFLSLLAAVAIMAAGGCSSDDDAVADAVDTNARPLIFHVSETPLADDDAPAATRTAPTTTSSLSAFSYCYLTGSTLSGQESASKNGSGIWSASSGWPSVDENATVSFYAYANAPSSACVYKKDSKVFLNFDVDETTYSQKDLLVAKQSDNYTHSGGNIGFLFSHACGAVRFSLSKTSGLADYDVQVKNVKIYNIPCSGTYCFDDGTWAIESDSRYNKHFTLKSYENDYLTVTSEKQYLSTDGDYLFLLPQTLTAWGKTGAPANAYVEIECKISQNGTFKVGTASNWGTAYLPLGITIKKGKINPVNISLGTALRNAQGGKIF